MNTQRSWFYSGKPYHSFSAPTGHSISVLPSKGWALHSRKLPFYDGIIVPGRSMSLLTAGTLQGIKPFAKRKTRDFFADSLTFNKSSRLQEGKTQGRIVCFRQRTGLSKSCGSKNLHLGLIDSHAYEQCYEQLIIHFCTNMAGLYIKRAGNRILRKSHRCVQR